MLARILEARVDFKAQRFSTPLMLSGAMIDNVTEATATVRLAVDGREATGRGCIGLSDLWAWPDPTRTHEQRDALLRDLCGRIAGDLSSLTRGTVAHPLELGLRLHHNVGHGANIGDPAVPPLARGVAMAPFDAAIHDAVGRAMNKDAMGLYDDDAPIPSADAMFGGPGGTVAAVRSVIRPARLPWLDAWFIVGRADDLQRDIRPWVTGRGYHAFKFKVAGKDNAVDVARTVEVYRAALGWGVGKPRLSIDSNEGNPSAQSVLDYLHRLRAADSAAYDAVEYLEQPTGRDIRVHRFDWRAVSALKPVVLDEGLTSFDLLDDALAQGWSGLALKTCKGHSFSLVTAAWAKRRGIPVAIQDLTNPGLAAIHSALFASRLDTLNGIELNSPQFTPASNAPWLPRLAPLLEPRDGRHRLPPGPIIGTGSDL
ncbi:MAG: hypothetical protein K8S99_03835 [Planctomycetes bacterium]|nr:hypothetical protein [Planctomycetota bacterium]